MEKNLHSSQTNGEAGLTKRQRRALKKQQKREELEKVRKKRGIKKAVYTVVTVGIIGIVLVGVVWLIAMVPSYPPIRMKGHIEVSPPSHILDTPMQATIQKHMLEHADGGGPPGIIIQYNCDKYECESDLVTKLTELVKEYPSNVYLAPSDYSGKIILTKLREREILDEFDDKKIRGFIGDVILEDEEATPELDDQEDETVASVKELSMVSGNVFFSPINLTLKKDQPVKITFRNTGSHIFTIDELGIKEPLRGNTVTVEFTPDQSGSFEYYCSVPGHREGGMIGALRVE